METSRWRMESRLVWSGEIVKLESLQYCKLSLVKSMLHKVNMPYYKRN